MPENLRSELLATGLSPENLRRRLRDLLNQPAPGRGVYDVSDYVRGQAERWLLWQQQDLRAATLPEANPQRPAVAVPPIDFPPDLRARVGGWTPNGTSIVYARNAALNMLEAFSDFVQSGEPERLGMTRTCVLDGAKRAVDREFFHFLKRRAAAAAASSPDLEPVAAE